MPQNLPHDVCCVSEQQISDKSDKWALAVGIPVLNYNDFWSSFAKSKEQQKALSTQFTYKVHLTAYFWVNGQDQVNYPEINA